MLSPVCYYGYHARDPKDLLTDIQGNVFLHNCVLPTLLELLSEDPYVGVMVYMCYTFDHSDKLYHLNCDCFFFSLQVNFWNE